MTSTSGTYRLGAVACVKFLATENMPRIIKDCCQSEAHNFEAAVHVGKQISNISSMIYALQNSSKLGAITPRDFDATKGEHWLTTNDVRKLAYFVQYCRIFCWSAPTSSV